MAQPLKRFVIPHIHNPSPKPIVLMIGTTHTLPEKIIYNENYVSQYHYLSDCQYQVKFDASMAMKQDHKVMTNI